MIVINIENSYSSLSGDFSKISSFTDLWNLLSYVKPGSGFASKCRTGFYKPSYVRLFNLKNNSFPTGLVDIVCNYFKVNNIEYQINDKRIIPEETISLRLQKSFPELRHYQKEVLNKVPQMERGIIEMATGTGKTQVLFSIIYKLKKSTLILVPSVIILQQTYKLLCHYFGKRSVGQITAGKAQLDKDIIIGTPQSVIKYIDVLSNKINCLCFDECHHCASETLRTINYGLKNAYYRMFFSATPFRNQGDDLELIGVIGSQNIITYDKIQAIKDGYLVPPIFIIHKFEHEDRGQETWQQEQKLCLITNEKYNEKVVQVTKDLIKQGRKCIIFVNEIDHGEKLQALLKGVIFVNGTKDRKYNREFLAKFAAGDIPCLVATSVCGEGADLVQGDAAVFASVGKSKGDILQKIGRIMRISPNKKFGIIVDFEHTNTIFLNKHFKERLKVYKTYQTKIYNKD